jgi:hypothetical protein
VNPGAWGTLFTRWAEQVPGSGPDSFPDWLLSKERGHTWLFEPGAAVPVLYGLILRDDGVGEPLSREQPFLYSSTRSRSPLRQP